jgi:uncharacterized protein (TIGR02611 family)
MLEVVAVRLGFRDRIRAHPVLGWVYRVAVGVVGALIIVLGIVMIPAPGPGWLVVFAGLGVLATEFSWAHRVLTYARRKVHAWTAWIKRQSLVVRIMVGLAGLAIIAGVVFAGLQGVGIKGFPFS